MDTTESVEDLFDVVDTVARLVNGPVAVEDVDFRVLAYSTVPGQPNDEARRAAILNRRTPDRWLRWMEESGFREKLLASEDVVQLEIPWTTFLPRYIQPIRASDQVVGYMWIMQGEEPLAADFARTAKESAALLAPELARRSRLFTDNPGGHVLRQFLGGGLSSARAAELLGVDEATVPVVIVTYDVPADPDVAAADAVVVRSQAVRALAIYARMQLQGCLVGSIDQQIYLLQAAPHLTAGDLDPVLDRPAQHLQHTLGVPIRAAAGAVHSGLTSANVSRREADDTMRVLRSRGSAETGSFTSFRHSIVLHEVIELLRGRHGLIDSIIEPLAEHDRLRATEYVRTLTIYLESFGDVRKAANRLHIHPNTLRYRITRLAEIAELDLANPDLRLALQLVLAVSERPNR